MTLTDHGGLTIEDLEAMPDDGRRYELIGGSIVVNAAPSPRHQWASGVLYDLLRRSCPDGHDEVADSTEGIDVDVPLGVVVPLAELFAPPG